MLVPITLNRARPSQVQPGVNLGSIWSLPGVNLGSIWRQPAPPYLVSVNRLKATAVLRGRSTAAVAGRSGCQGLIQLHCF
jgi:hypothetical protein